MIADSPGVIHAAVKKTPATALALTKFLPHATQRQRTGDAVAARNKDLACPQCHTSGRRVTIPGPLPNPHPQWETLRRYRCLECDAEYVTRETPTHPAIPHLRVVPPRHPEGETGSIFTHAKLLSSLRDHIPKILTDEERLGVADDVTAALESRVREQLRTSGSDVVTVTTAELTSIILSSLRSASRRARVLDPERVVVAHVQFALAHLGFRTAEGFLAWLRQEHPRPHRQVMDLTQAWRMPPVEWTLPPVAPPTDITTVVKNVYISTHPRQRLCSPYDETKVLRSLALALRGRPEHAALQEGIYHYTRWALIGQHTVRASQLSSCIAEALRAVDDIAYLRWVVIGKELRLEQIYDEAAMLCQYPSPRLQLTVPQRPPLRPSGLQHHAAG